MKGTPRSKEPRAERITDRLRQIFQTAISAFVESEADNILKGTSERNLCGRLAPLLEAQARANGYPGYVADVEYNRNEGGEVKTIVDDKFDIVPITCDVILHSRGRIPEKDNLIAIEMKRIEHSEREKQKDRIRLQALTKESFDGVWSSDGKTLPEHVCGYELGYLLMLDAGQRRFHIEEYIRGKLSDRFDQAF